MKTSKIIAALEGWSPTGLCSGELIKQNGVKANTVGCAVGCMTLEFLTTDEGKNFLEKELMTKKDYVHKRLIGEGSLDSDLGPEVKAHFNITEELVCKIMGFNDSVLIEETTDLNPSCTTNDLPRDLRRTITRLRKRHENFLTSKAISDQLLAQRLGL